MKLFILGSVMLLASASSGTFIPVDTPEVAAAKAAHFAAHAGSNQWDHPVKKWHGPIHIPVIHKGIPVETPEVQHAKAFHAVAFAKVAGYGGYHGPEPYHASVDHHDEGGAWHGPLHVPVIKHGVPVETPEVQHAKAAHLDTLANAHSRPAAWADGHVDDGSYKPELYESAYY